ncbi:MAG: DNA/RNA non-specific endonuclease [Planctomycetota bacterium]|nr:DNA/RNA non-specific endonuclease [Planctomycetota bacterium]
MRDAARLAVFLVVALFLLSACIGTPRKSAKTAVETLPEKRTETSQETSPERHKEVPTVRKPSHRHAYWGLPKGGENLCQLERTAFTSGYSTNHKQPLWVAYNVNWKTLETSQERENKFKPDPAVPEKESATDNDYKNSGYDRGHIAPFKSVCLKGDPNAAIESFYFSNICPQKPELNRRGPWRELEDKERDWAQKFGEVWIVAGPIFDEDLGTLNNKGRIPIPSKFYKIIVRNDGNEVKVLAFMMRQDDKGGKKDLEKFLVSVDEIEEKTGFDFLPELPDEIEEQVESKKAGSLWENIPSKSE